MLFTRERVASPNSEFGDGSRVEGGFLGEGGMPMKPGEDAAAGVTGQEAGGGWSRPGGGGRRARRRGVYREKRSGRRVAGAPMSLAGAGGRVADGRMAGAGAIGVSDEGIVGRGGGWQGGGRSDDGQKGSCHAGNRLDGGRGMVCHSGNRGVSARSQAELGNDSAERSCTSHGRCRGPGWPDRPADSHACEAQLRPPIGIPKLSLGMSGRTAAGVLGELFYAIFSGKLPAVRAGNAEAEERGAFVIRGDLGRFIVSPAGESLADLVSVVRRLVVRANLVPLQRSPGAALAPTTASGRYMSALLPSNSALSRTRKSLRSINSQRAKWTVPSAARSCSMPTMRWRASSVTLFVSRFGSK